MSVIRHRRRNLILSGLIGGVIGMMLAAGGLYLARVPLAEQLNLGHTVVEKAPEAPKVSVLVAAKPIAAGKTIAESDIMEIQVEAASSVVRHYESASLIVGKQATVNIDTNMPLTEPLFAEAQAVSNQERIYEVSFVELLYTMNKGDTVDVRIAFPTGQEFVVLSKKEVMGFHRQQNNIHEGLLGLSMNEEEALRMSSALVDKCLTEGSRVYMVKYVMPELQEAAAADYPINPYVQQLYETSPNIRNLKDLDGILSDRSKLDEALAAIGELEAFEGADMTSPAIAVDFGTGLESQPQDDGVAEPATKPPVTEAPEAAVPTTSPAAVQQEAVQQVTVPQATAQGIGF